MWDADVDVDADAGVNVYAGADDDAVLGVKMGHSLFVVANQLELFVVALEIQVVCLLWIKLLMLELEHQDSAPIDPGICYPVLVLKDLSGPQLKIK